MGLTIDIRSYRDTDKAGIIALWQIVFPGSTAWNEAEDVIARKRSVQPDLFYVALNEGQVVATVIAGYDGVRGWIHRLAVHPDMRRAGLASKLMQRAERGLKEVGCPKLNLQVRASNLEVLKFYESLGYSVEDRASLGKPLL
jgi:ribosomal protein S18 acetylase RimI-like enzyme